MKIYYLYAYLFLMLCVGFAGRKSAKTNEDYYAAGRKAGSLYVAGSLLATILGSSAILGSVELAGGKGWAGAWLMLCGAFGLLVLSLLVKKLRGFRGYNLPSLLGKMYGGEVQKISSAVIVTAWIGVIASQIIGAAGITSAAFGVSYVRAALLVTSVTILYTAMGGQISIIKTDLLQLMMLAFGIALLFLAIWVKKPEITALPMLSSKFTPLDLLVMLLTYSTTYIVGPDIYSRLFCAKDGRAARLSLVISAVALVPAAFCLAYIGIYCARFSPAGQQPVLYAAAASELSPAADLAFCFAMLAAIMSSADTTLFTAGSLMSQLLYPDMETKKSVRATRLCIAAAGILSLCVALRFRSLLFVLLLALGTYAGAFIIPVLLGMFGFRAGKKYVVAAILAGGSLASAGKFISGSAGSYIIISSFILNLLIMLLGRENKTGGE